MIIGNVSVKRFKAISGEGVYSFKPGLNVIIGKNEAGKSSLREAVVKALYQDPTTSKEEVIDLTSWGTDEPWEIELEFKDDSKSYKLIKSLKHRANELKDLKFSSSITNKNAIADKISELTGCSSEILFESLACIGQDELIGLVPKSATAGEKQDAVGTITKRLQEKLTGVSQEVNVKKIMDKLFKKTHHKSAKGPYYHLEGIEKTNEEFQRDKAGLEEKVNMVMENRVKLNKVKDRLSGIDQELPSKEELIENNKILELEKNIADGKKLYTTFGRAKEFNQQLVTLKKDLKGFDIFQDSQEKIKELEKIEAQIEISEKIEKPVVQKPSNLGLTIGIASLLIGAIGYTFFPVFGVLALAGLLLIFYWLVSSKKGNEQIEEKVPMVEARKLNKRKKKLLDELGFDSYEMCMEKFSIYEEKIKDASDAENKLKGIIGDKTWSEFENENIDLEISVNATKKELEKYLPFKITDPLELQELEKTVSQFKESKKDLDGKKKGLDEFFKLTDADTDQLAYVNEELLWFDEERKFYENKKQVYDIVRNEIERANNQTLSKATVVLEEELGKFISIITDGRYEKVKVDENNLEIWTESPEKNDDVKIEKLSRATQDQFYISARFALINLITEGKKPPILLDDPFVNFDEKRLPKMLSLIQNLAIENQILLFTCDNSYESYGNVIRVGAD